MLPDTPDHGVDPFTESARRVVEYLQDHSPLSDWSVTRVAGGEQIQVHVGGQHLLAVGRRLNWSDSFCNRMINGAAPVVVDTLTDPDYADLEHSGTVRAYAGVPLTDDTGEMFGVLCGFDTEPLGAVDDVDSDLIGLLGDLLSTHLALARTADRQYRAVKIAEALAQTDALTGLTNRRGWDALVHDAEQRMHAYGDLVAVAVLDLDGLKAINDQQGHAAGDRLLAQAGGTLAGAARRGDRVARYGGDEFAILANNVAVTDLDAHFAAYATALSQVGIAASWGYANATPRLMPVVDAFSEADRAMYASKSEQRAAR